MSENNDMTPEQKRMKLHHDLLQELNASAGNEPLSHTDALCREVDKYYATDDKYVDNVLDYWSNQPSLPILSQVAQVYFGMALSSVPVECLFSTATLVANGKRSSLSPYKLEQILFVHDNFNFIL